LILIIFRFFSNKHFSITTRVWLRGAIDHVKCMIEQRITALRKLDYSLLLSLHPAAQVLEVAGSAGDSNRVATLFYFKDWYDFGSIPLS
jgi:hypothetical protein